jgi:hypothetical protein
MLLASKLFVRRHAGELSFLAVLALTLTLIGWFVGQLTHKNSLRPFGVSFVAQPDINDGSTE